MMYALTFDADNTLWDTNSVFWDAQVEMLAALASEGILDRPEERVDELRVLDRELMAEVGRNEYDFRALADALIAHYKHSQAPEEAVRTVVENHNNGESYSDLAKQAHGRFTEALKKLPPLLPDVPEALNKIRTHRESGDVITALLSEGDSDRLYRILASHDDISEEYFDVIVITPKKNVSAFEEVKQAVRAKVDQEVTYVMIGDSISSDIRPANESGFISVYKPGDFEGFEEPNDPSDRPDYTVDSLLRVTDLLRSLQKGRAELLRES